MSNTKHYELERRVENAIETMHVADLRHALRLFVKDASVLVVNELAIRLGVPRT